jgi:chromosome partitioning protein
MLKVLPVINNKGGVGKTTSAVNLAACLARRGHRVLLVDLDSQGSATLSLGVERSEPSSASALYRRAQLADVVRPTSVPNLSVAPGTLALANADVRLAAVPNRVGRLRQVLAPVRDEYDVIVLDCSPSASLLTVNALVAADALIIPLSPDYLAVQGLLTFGKMVRNVRKALGRIAPVLGIFLTNADPTCEETGAVADALGQRFGGKMFETTIRPDKTLRAAPIHGQDIYSFAPDSTAALDYAALAQEVENRVHRYSHVFTQQGTPTVTVDQAIQVERAASISVAA